MLEFPDINDVQRVKSLPEGQHLHQHFWQIVRGTNLNIYHLSVPSISLLKWLLNLVTLPCLDKLVFVFLCWLGESSFIDESRTSDQWTRTTALAIMIFFSLFFALLYSVSPSPIVKILEQSQSHQFDDFSIPLDHCVLTPKLGYSGTKQFLEECEGIGKIDQEGRQLSAVS